MLYFLEHILRPLSDVTGKVVLFYNNYRENGLTSFMKIPVLCTATQPALEYVENKLEVNPDGEIIDNLNEVITAFKRVEIIDQATGIAMNNNHIAGLAGLLHDMGKFTDSFRTYILEAVQNPDHPPKRGSIDHSTAGGKLLYELYHQERRQLNTSLLASYLTSDRFCQLFHFKKMCFYQLMLLISLSDMRNEIHRGSPYLLFV